MRGQYQHSLNKMKDDWFHGATVTPEQKATITSYGIILDEIAELNIETIEAANEALNEQIRSTPADR